MLESHYPPPPPTHLNTNSHMQTLSLLCPRPTPSQHSNDKHTHIQTEGIFFSFALCFLQRVICAEGAVKVG